MNRYRYIHSAIALCIILLADACSERYSDGYETLHPSSELKFLNISILDNDFSGKAQGGTVQYEIYTNNSRTAWRFSDLPDWISTDVQNGVGDHTGTYTIHENLSTEKGRSCIFYVSSAETNWEYQIPINISQNAAIPYLNLCDNNGELLKNGTTLAYTGKSNTVKFNIESNTVWTVSTKNSNDWITLSPESGKNSGSFTMQLNENPNTVERNATITVSYGQKYSYTLYISQQPASVSVNIGTLSFTPAAGTTKLDITSDINWQATTNVSWIDLKPTSGEAGISKMSISVTPNASSSSRSGFIYIKTGSNTRHSITVTQEGEQLYTSTKSLSFNRGNSSEQSIELMANVEWEILTKPEWISLNQSEGKGNATLTITADDNPSSNSRNGVLSFSIKGRNEVTASINIIQSGKTITLSRDVLQFSDKQGSQSVKIESDGVWNAGCPTIWISLSPASGNGDGELTVGVSENTSYEKRTGTINVQLYEINKSISVEQQSKYFDLTSQEIKFPSKGGQTTLSVSTNDKWDAQTTENVSWLTLTKGQDGDTPILQIVAADNNTALPRSATIEVSTQGGRKIALAVTQDVRTLKVSQSKISFFPKGGSSTVLIETDGSYTITQTGNWFSITQETGSFTVTTSENNTKNDRNGSITITLTDITVGEISVTLPVIQIKSGSSFNQDGYGNDANWNATNNPPKGEFNITGFSSDADWNKSSKKEGGKF